MKCRLFDEAVWSRSRTTSNEHEFVKLSHVYISPTYLRFRERVFHERFWKNTSFHGWCLKSLRARYYLRIPNAKKNHKREKRRIFAKRIYTLLQDAWPNNRGSRFKLRNIAKDVSNNCDRLIVANPAAEYDEISATFPADGSHRSQCSHFMYESRKRRIREGLIKSTSQKRTCVWGEA